MNLSFTEQYYPDLSELSEAAITATREEVVAFLQPYMPEVDLAPGTPTGDFVVTPLSVYRAAAEESNSRLMSDLDLANVADGLIYSCEFVQAYLGNFGVYDVENLKAFGLVRLTYSSAAALTVPRTVRYRFGNSDDWSPKITDPDATEITVLPPGSSHPGTADTYILSQTSSTTWAVDIPVEGDLTSPVTAGTAGTSTEVPDTLVGISAAIDFLSGLPSASLSELARMARKLAFSLTAGSRASTKALVYRNWPEANMVSPIVPGDPEMQRVAQGSAIALQAPAVDLYFRSSRDMQRESQNVRLEYVQSAAGGGKVFRGNLSLLHRASQITDIDWSGTSDDERVTSYTVYSKTDRSDLYGSLHCGTRFESLFVELVPEVDGSDVPLIPLLDDGEGNQYAIFTVTYDADPLLDTVSSLLESPDYRPAGVDVLTKSGPLMVFDDITITYSKQTGVQTTLSTAREKVVEYHRTAGYPDPYRVTEIYDIMRNAGAQAVLSIDVTARVEPSAASRLLNDTIADPGGDDFLKDWATESDALSSVAITSVESATDPNLIIDGEITPGGPLDAWAGTLRTVRYAVDPENVNFIES